MLKNTILLLGILLSLGFAERALAAEAFLAWQASPSPDTSGYYLYYDTLSHASGTCPNDYQNYTQPIDVGKVTSFTLSGLSEGQTYYFQIVAYNNEGNQSTCSIEPGEQSLSFPASSTPPVVADSETSSETIITTTPSSGGGGGGGGSSVGASAGSTVTETPSTPSQTALPQATSISPIMTDIISTGQLNPVTNSSPNTLYAEEAKGVVSRQQFVNLSPTEVGLYLKVINATGDAISDQDKRILANFIKIGAPSTQILGAGERAGTLSSYLSTFAHLPSAESDWHDVLKIANGRWTDERNLVAEKNSETLFNEIYHRAPERSTNKYDDNAIMIMTYGLRPTNRNISSEAAAINSFKNIFKRLPEKASDWDTVRTIAYSGAKR